MNTDMQSQRESQIACGISCVTKHMQGDVVHLNRWEQEHLTAKGMQLLKDKWLPRMSPEYVREIITAALDAGV